MRRFTKGNRDVGGWLTEIEALRQGACASSWSFRFTRPIPYWKAPTPSRAAGQERSVVPDPIEGSLLETSDCPGSMTPGDTMTATGNPFAVATVHGLYHIAIRPTIWRQRENSTSTSWARGNSRGPIWAFPAPGSATQPGGLAIMHIYAGGRRSGPRQGAGDGGDYQSRCPARAIAPMSRASRRRGSTGAN